MAGVQQDRYSGLARNSEASICEKSILTSDYVQNGQNFGLALNISPSSSDHFQVLTFKCSHMGPNSLGSPGCRKAKGRNIGL